MRPPGSDRPRGAERVPGVTGEQEGARQQDGQQGVPALVGEVADRCDVLEAGAGDDRVEAAEALDRGLHRRAVALARREVGLEGLAGAVGVRPEIDREHPGAVALEPLRDRAADPAGRT